MKKFIALLMCLVFFACCVAGCSENKSEITLTDPEDTTVIGETGPKGTADDKNELVENVSDYVTTPENAQVGDYITFGSYEQDNDTTNGKEDIQWLVLEKQEDKILVLSKYALDYVYFSEENKNYELPQQVKNVSWENSTVRKWLNNEFVRESFSAEEANRIPTVTVSVNANDEYYLDEGEDTKDRLFLLSVDEALEYFPTDEERICLATEYIKGNVAIVGNQTDSNAMWGLRTRKKGNIYVSVLWNGDFYNNSVGDIVIVRPAMWINLN